LFHHGVPFSLQLLSCLHSGGQQLEAERDAMVKQTVERYKMEANLMSERHQMEEKQRLEAIEVERQRLEREELERVERRKQAEEERRQKLAAEEEKRKLAEEEKRKRQIEAKEKAEEKRRLAERQAMEQRQREETQRRQEEENNRKQKRLQEEAMLQQKKQEEQLRKVRIQETTIEKSGGGVLKSPCVTRRSDDINGLGFGQVRTGSVISRKISFMQRAGSLEPDPRAVSESPAPRRRTVRFAGLESPSPTGQAPARPKVQTGSVSAEVQRWTQGSGWTQMVTQMDRDAVSQSPVPFSPSQRRSLSESRSFSPVSPVSPTPRTVISPVAFSSPTPPSQQVPERLSPPISVCSEKSA